MSNINREPRQYSRRELLIRAAELTGTGALLAVLPPLCSIRAPGTGETPATTPAAKMAGGNKPTAEPELGKVPAPEGVGEFVGNVDVAGQGYELWRFGMENSGLKGEDIRTLLPAGDGSKVYIGYAAANSEAGYTKLPVQAMDGEGGVEDWPEVPYVNDLVEFRNWLIAATDVRDHRELDTGLLAIDRVGIVRNLTEEASKQLGYPVDYRNYGLFVERDGEGKELALWVATWEGVYKLANGKWEQVIPGSLDVGQMKSNHFHDMAVNKKGVLAAGSIDNGFGIVYRESQVLEWGGQITERVWLFEM